MQDFNIVIGGIFAILIRAQINAEDTVFRAGFQAFGDGGGPVIVKPKPIDDCFVFGKAKQPRFGVAVLGQGG